MPGKYYEYTSYPGRQLECTVVPRCVPHYFFDGVQSITATHNTDDYTHGQYGANSDVLIAKNYHNTTGVIEYKDFSNVLYVLRGMTGMDPASSALFDPAHFKRVDFCINTLNSDRLRVMRSSWIVDLMPTLHEALDLDNMGTGTVDYAAARKLDFEGYQIVYQEWMNGKQGQDEFELFYPAQVLVRDALAHELGLVQHELCPIKYMLRVIVGGQVLLDSDQAWVTTIALGDDVRSTLHLKTPLATPGTPVIAFWLADGKHVIGRHGITIAPVMSDVVPNGDWAIAGSGWDGTLTVYFSEAIKNVESLSIDSNNEFSNFVLQAVELDNLGNVVASGSVCPYDIGGGKNGNPARFAQEGLGLGGTLISRNKLYLDFTGSTGYSSLPSPIPVVSGHTLIWNLQYRAVSGVLPLQGEDTDAITPSHSLDIRTDIH